MPKVLKYLLWLLGGLVLLVGLAATYNEVAPLPTYEVELPAAVTIPYGDSLAIAEGARIVSMSCALCHRNQEGKLVGQPLPEDDFGEIYIGNITNHRQAGIGRYTDEELVHLIRTGIRPDGQLLLPIMPQFYKMADEDLYNVIAYLRSDLPAVAPVNQAWPEKKLNFLGKALSRVAFKPAPMPQAPVAAPENSDLVPRGEYLADVVYNCYQCHSASFATNNDHEPHLSAGYYGGGNPIGRMDGMHEEITLSANLTMHPEHGLGKWTAEDFAQAVRQVRRPDRMLSAAMPPFTALTDDEVGAIWAFLQTVPIQDNNPQEELVQH